MNTTETLKLVGTYLPREVRESLLRMDERYRQQVQEIRLRAGRQVCLTLAGGNAFLCANGTLSASPDAALCLTQEAVSQCLQAVMSYSLHSHTDDLAAGFVTIRGGCRVGLCGTAVRDGERIHSLRQVSSLNFRIAGAFPGIAENAFRQTGACGSLLVCGAPGSGKTTYLRDLCRLLGDRHRTCLIDERGELAAVYQGVAQHDVGHLTDVLDGYPRALGILTALRVLNPEHILCDELSTQEDVEAVLAAAGCGVALSASVHAGSLDELQARPLLAPLFGQKVFRYAVMLTSPGTVGSIRRVS